MWGWEHGDESVDFFLKIFFQNFFHPMIKMVYLFTLELKHGQGGDYLFHCLFLDNIILFGRSVGMGAWGQEIWDGSNFFLMINFQNMFFIL